MLHRSYLIYRACFQPCYLDAAAAESALFVRAEKAAHDLVEWAHSGKEGTLDKGTADSALSSVKALRALVRDCGAHGKGVYGQAATTTVLENTFGAMQGHRGVSVGGVAGAMDTSTFARKSTALSLAGLANMDAAWDAQCVMAAARPGANVLGAGGDDRELAAACALGLLSRRAAADAVAEAQKDAEAAWKASAGVRSAARRPAALKLSCTAGVITFSTEVGRAADPTKAAYKQLLVVSQAEPPPWTWSGGNYARLDYAVHSGLRNVPPVQPGAPRERVPVRTNDGLLDRVAAALRLAAGHGGRLDALLHAAGRRRARVRRRLSRRLCAAAARPRAPRERHGRARQLPRRAARARDGVGHRAPAVHPRAPRAPRRLRARAARGARGRRGRAQPRGGRHRAARRGGARRRARRRRGARGVRARVAGVLLVRPRGVAEAGLGARGAAPRGGQVARPQALRGGAALL